ncbi:hypothetical protein [Dickeya zeae]|uniref:hypothetical protein n=1 Tax=Dickeya zeae TaxID=204042 RepID=UPI0014438A20|nr:hypothetical protein [Dickeya zeae]
MFIVFFDNNFSLLNVIFLLQGIRWNCWRFQSQLAGIKTASDPGGDAAAMSLRCCKLAVLAQYTFKDSLLLMCGRIHLFIYSFIHLFVFANTKISARFSGGISQNASINSASWSSAE